MNKETKKYQIIILLLGAIAVLYFLFNINVLVKNTTNTFKVQNGRIYQEESAIGYLIRDEQLIENDEFKNGIIPIKVEGEKTGNVEPIFKYYTSNQKQLIDLISELNIKIEEEFKTDNILISNDVKALEKDLQKEIQNMYGENQKLKVTEYENKIKEKIINNLKIVEQSTGLSENVKKIISEKLQAEKELESYMKYIYSTKSGIVSYKIDGFERILTPAILTDIDANFYRELDIKRENISDESTDAAKIIDNFNCYIVTNLKSKEIKNAKIGDEVKIKALDLDEITAKIYSIKKEQNEYIVTLKFENNIKELINYRKINFEIIWWSFEGLKVPNSSIFVEEGINYIIRERVGYTDKIPVVIKKKNENFSIIENYTSTELKELNYSSDILKNIKSITLFDEILN